MTKQIKRIAAYVALAFFGILCVSPAFIKVYFDLRDAGVAADVAFFSAVGAFAVMVAVGAALVFGIFVAVKVLVDNSD